MKNRKILLLLAAIVVFLLAIPFWAEKLPSQPRYLYVRYLLALIIAFPTILYAIKKYRQTAVRFYVLPCFSIVLGFLLAGMFFSMKMSEAAIRGQNSYAINSEYVETFNGDSNKHIYFANSKKVYYSDEDRLFFEEKFNAKNDTIRFWN